MGVGRRRVVCSCRLPSPVRVCLLLLFLCFSSEHLRVFCNTCRPEMAYVLGRCHCGCKREALSAQRFVHALGTCKVAVGQRAPRYFVCAGKGLGTCCTGRDRSSM